jgi:hypothetical protein
MGSRHHVHLTVGGETYEYMTFYHWMGHEHPETEYVIGGPNHGPKAPDHERPVIEPDRDDWSIELPAVLWLMDRVRDGAITLEEARKELVEITAPPGGCCWACAGVEEPEDELLARCATEREQWLNWWNAVTSQTHPYAVSQSSIHRWDCRHVYDPTPPVITSKHQYATTGRPQPTMPNRRLTVDEARVWLAPYRTKPRPPRCKVCVPDLPDAWRDETSDVPSTR